MLTYNLNLFPSTGRVFTDKDGSRHRAATWSDLENKVIDYRVRNGFPVNDVWAEIMAQICAALPAQCYEDSGLQHIPLAPQAKAKPGINRQNLGSRVLAWVGWCLKEKRANRLQKVVPTDAARRATICKTCPMQTPLTSGCPTCSGTISTGRKAVMEGESFADANLQGCAALVEDTRLSVHLVLASTTSKAVPSFCWRLL